MPVVLRNIIRFVILLLIQILILNNVRISGSFVLPQVYILAILLLPFNSPPWLDIIIGFLVGLIIDVSLNTLGFHALACATIGYLKHLVANFLSPRDGYDFNSEPSVIDQGFIWFSAYAGILILAHHTILFYIEALSWSNFFWTLLKVISSGLFSLILILTYQYIFITRKVK